MKINGLVFLLVLAGLFIFSGFSLFGQFTDDPNDRLYRFLSLWEEKGYIENVPPIRPYPPQLLKRLLREVQQVGERHDRKVAEQYYGTLFPRDQGKDRDRLLKGALHPSFVAETMTETEDIYWKLAAHIDTLGSIGSYVAFTGNFAYSLIDDPGENALSPIGSVYHGDVGEHQADIPQLSIRNSVADDLLHGLPHTAVSLRQQINSTGQPFSMSLKTRVTIKSTARYVPEAVTWNVVGYLEGSDPTVSDEYVVVGAHLDHVGNQAGVLFAGAQDNASGSVMVLALAEAMSKSPVKPRRSVFFVLFAGEELFLAGSEYFASNPPWPISKAAGMINLDMVGTGPELRMDGGATTPAFQQMAVEADRLYGGFNLADQSPTPAVPGASDHSAFINAGVPTIYMHSRGASGRVHTPEDVASTIDYDAFFRTTRVVYLTLFQIADRL